MKRFEVRPGLLSCWECGSRHMYIGSRMCPSKPEESLTKFMYYVECKDCGCATGCHDSAKSAVKSWNAAYTTPEEIENLQEFNDAVFMG